jgi:hypothetical protein
MIGMVSPDDGIARRTGIASSANARRPLTPDDAAAAKPALVKSRLESRMQLSPVLNRVCRRNSTAQTPSIPKNKGWIVNTLSLAVSNRRRSDYYDCTFVIGRTWSVDCDPAFVIA